MLRTKMTENISLRLMFPYLWEVSHTQELLSLVWSAFHLSCSLFVLSTRRHPAHPVPVLLLHPREIEGVWLQITRQRWYVHNAERRVDNAMPCQRTGCDKHNIHEPANQEKTENSSKEDKTTGWKGNKTKRKNKRDCKKSTQSMRQSGYSRRAEQVPRKVFGRDETKPNTTENHQQSESKADHKQESMQQPAWVRMQLEALPRVLSLPCHILVITASIPLSSPPHPQGHGKRERRKEKRKRVTKTNKNNTDRKHTERRRCCKRET
ncbi:unnamed protein product [Laminaria digitata]